LTKCAARNPLPELISGESASVAGHALGLSYHLGQLPNDTELRMDLQTAIRAYRALTFRGGLETEIGDEMGDELIATGNTSLIEIRRYKAYRRIERSVSASRLAKKHHGTRCQVCSFQFAEKYGSLGDGFIEVHHLIPISRWKKACRSDTTLQQISLYFARIAIGWSIEPRILRTWTAFVSY
jgi:hypothetical protein